jgi:NADPH2:quinone reductase
VVGWISTGCMMRCIQAAADLTAAASQGALRIPIGAGYPLNDIATAHEHVDHGPRRGRILVRLDL